MQRLPTWDFESTSSASNKPFTSAQPDAITGPRLQTDGNGAQLEGSVSLNPYTQAEGLHLNKDFGQHLEETAPLDSDGAQRIPTKQSKEGFGSLLLNTQTDGHPLNQNIGQPLEEIARLDSDGAQRTTTKHGEQALITKWESSQDTPGDGDLCTVFDAMHTADTSLEDSSYVDSNILQNAEARNLAMTYSSADSEGSALKLVYHLRPEWETTPGTVNIIRFTGGIMNTVCYFLQNFHSF